MCYFTTFCLPAERRQLSRQLAAWLPVVAVRLSDIRLDSAHLISDHQWPSVVINSNQWSSVAINGHQWPSMAINGTRFGDAHLINAQSCG